MRTKILLSLRFPAETVEMSKKIICKIMCKECAIEIHGKKKLRDAVSHPSDATLKCPAFDNEGSCKSERVSYRQFFIGSCCESASRWLTKNEKGKIKLPYPVGKVVLGQKEKLKIVESFCSKSMTELHEANEKSKALIAENGIDEERIKQNEKRIEELKKSNDQMKNNWHEKEEKIAELKSKVDKFNEEHDAASKRMDLLSFEYFDAAKKSKEEKSKIVEFFQINIINFS